MWQPWCCFYLVTIRVLKFGLQGIGIVPVICEIKDAGGCHGGMGRGQGASAASSGKRYNDPRLRSLRQLAPLQMFATLIDTTQVILTLINLSYA